MEIKVFNTGIYGVNTLLVHIDEKNVFVVDPAGCIETQDEKIVSDYIKQNSLSLSGILLTHGHFDHITGTKILKHDFGNIKIACHKDDFSMCGRNAFSVQWPFVSGCAPVSFSSALKNLPDPDVILKGGETLDLVFQSESENLSALLKNWLVISTPGHTEGSVCFYNKKENVLISGDTVFYHSYGRTDLPGGNQNKMNKSLTYIYRNFPESKVYPGHDVVDFFLSENE